MRVGLGPRFLIEAGFIIAVAVVAGIERLRTLLIVALMAAAWLVVVVVEFLASRVRAASQVSVIAQTEPESAPEVSPGPSPDVTPREPPAPEQPEPPPEEPEPAPEPPRIAAVVSLPEPEPEPVAQPPSEPEPQVVPFARRSSGPREWNIWDLERLAREPTGDTVRDEERSYLLIYLREFAAADGLLPADFDGIVRESFGDVLDAARS